MRTLKNATPAIAGADVAAWQRFLKAKAMLHGSVDGKFGHLAEISTIAYQQKMGLAADGVVGPQTIERAKADGFVTAIHAANAHPVAVHPATDQSPVVAISAHNENGPSYDLASGVVLSAVMRPLVDAIAHDFLALTGKRLTVTSGTRSAESQAKAMKEKLDLKDDLLKLYRNKEAAQEIIDTYDCTPPAGRTQAITQKVQDQMAKGVFISLHLTGYGVDFRDRDLNRDERKKLAAIIDDHKKDDVRGALTVIPEGKPPHVHIQLNIKSVK